MNHPIEILIRILGNPIKLSSDTENSSFSLT